MASIQINSQGSSEEEKRRKHREAQKRYMDRQRLGWQAYFETDEICNNQIAQLNSQLVEKQASITILQSQLNEKDTNISLLQQINNVNESSRLQLQSQLNDSLNIISNLRSINSQLQSQLTRSADCEPNVVQLRSQLAQKDDTISQLQEQTSQLQQQVSEKDRTISQLQEQTSQLQQQVSEKDRTIFQLQSQTSQLQQQNSEKDSTISQLQLLNSQKDSTISQLHIQLNGCVTVDVDSRLQEMSQALANEMERQRLCLQTINQLNSENSSLKVFRDIISELNSKYPKILPSFVSEILQPGNQSPYPEINTWAREQSNKITPDQILPLTFFKTLSPAQAQVSPYAAFLPSDLTNISNLNPNPNPNLLIPNVNLLLNTSVPQGLADTSNINHPAANDPEFQRWLYLYNNNLKNTREYNNHYQNIRNRYGIPPVQLLQRYTRH